MEMTMLDIKLTLKKGEPKNIAGLMIFIKNENQNMTKYDWSWKNIEQEDEHFSFVKGNNIHKIFVDQIEKLSVKGNKDKLFGGFISFLIIPALEKMLEQVVYQDQIEMEMTDVKISSDLVKILFE